MPVDFCTLFEPLSVDLFLASYWEAKPIHISGNGSRNFDDLVAPRDLDQFLSRSDIRYPSVRLVQGGVELTRDEYTREFRLGGHLSDDLIVNDRLFSAYNAGATIVVQQLQQSLPGFGVVTNAFEEAFGCNVHASAFITPPRSQGFTAHYDTHSFLAFQLSGSKNWNLYDTTALPPIREDRETELPWSQVAPTQQIELHAGDLLYVPRGTFHDAETSDDPSIHMTIGFFPPTWLDVTRAAISAASSQKTLRHAVPVAYEQSDLDAAVTDTIANLDLLGALRLLQSGYQARRTDVRSGRLLDALSEQEWCDETRLRPHPHLSFSIENAGPDRLKIAFFGKQILLPEAIQSTLKVIASRPSFTLGELQRTLDRPSTYTLCRRLVREGLLTVDR